MSSIPGVAAAGFTAAQIANFSSSDIYSGCAGLSAAHMSNITAAAYEGFTAACIKVIPGSSFAAISPDQIRQVTVAACAGFTGPQGITRVTLTLSNSVTVGNLRDDTTIALSIDQLEGFSRTGVSGFRHSVRVVGESLEQHIP
jgi:hypothetical protein